MILTRDGDQLQLELDDVRVEIPWGGVSPRTLTRCGKLFTLEGPPTGGLHVDADPAQLTIFLQGNPYGS